MSKKGKEITATRNAPSRSVAEKRFRQKIMLLRHIGTYAVINVFLVVVWALTGAGYPWFTWSIVGWGMLLSLHVVHTAISLFHTRGAESAERVTVEEVVNNQKPVIFQKNHLDYNIFP